MHLTRPDRQHTEAASYEEAGNMHRWSRNRRSWKACSQSRGQFGSSADLRVIAPEREFRYRPISDASLFRPAKEGGAG